MTTPLSAVKKGTTRACLEILVPKVEDPIIPFCFNPTEFQLQKTNTFAEVPIPGLESPPIQFVRGTCEKLIAELLVDTSDTLEDVRTKYVNKLRNLMRVNRELHAPPIVRFAWDSQIFVGVMEGLNVTYVLFTPKGIPLRAKLNVTLKEYRPAAVQVKDQLKNSPDVEKTYVTRRGDTLSGIAAAVLGDAGTWRELARANQIQDPRYVAPGRVLKVPRLR
jgi:hypothetical protein